MNLINEMLVMILYLLDDLGLRHVNLNFIHLYMLIEQDGITVGIC